MSVDRSRHAPITCKYDSTITKAHANRHFPVIIDVAVETGEFDMPTVGLRASTAGANARVWGELLSVFPETKTCEVQFEGLQYYRAAAAYARANNGDPIILPGTTVTSATVAIDTAINGRDYKGDGTVGTGQSAGDELFLVTVGGAASKFQVSDGNTAYADATVAEALGTNGRFLGVITGAEAGSTSVVSDAAAKAYFDADASRYDSDLTYYFFDGTDLKTVTYMADADQVKPIATVGDTSASDVSALIQAIVGAPHIEGGFTMTESGLRVNILKCRR